MALHEEINIVILAHPLYILSASSYELFIEMVVDKRWSDTDTHMCTDSMWQCGDKFYQYLQKLLDQNHCNPSTFLARALQLVVGIN